MLIPTTCAPHKKSDSFSSLSSESLHMCTEGLGFESSDDAEEWKNEVRVWKVMREKDGGSYYEKKRLGLGEYWRRRWLTTSRGQWKVCFEEIRTPSQEVLPAHREDGRLKLHIVQPDQDEEFMEEEGDDCDDADGGNHGEEDLMK
ncbi:hypothetical protein VNO80_24947 [Phaseolus coccineus]|uniref:Uncharacterized protein n=1 Tax=Phaseolus coccineus TaxID=3886 RepID=A0AAN9QPN7_PHACN